ncbi:MAG: polysaccharide lyase 6 family protein [Anaeroplasma bactoclasticum]|nr:polysaccharide lyase 6 family protein [Anaeroplasma bactoclasticum]
MKKYLTILAGVGLMLTLVACNNTSEKQPPIEDDNPPVVEVTPTNFEIVQEVFENFSIPNSDSIIKNIYLPKSTKEEVSIVWRTSNAKVITPEGYVTRSAISDQTVTMTATATLGSTVERRSYQVTVKKIPSDVESLVQESVDDFVLYENNYVDRDILILPRTSDLNGVYITWETSNDKIIDLDGNVYRTSAEQKVTLTAKFSKDDVTLEKSYDVTVGSTSDDEPELITENDSRILNKIYVKNTEEILKACVVDGLKPGDAVILEDGTYNEITLNITDSGTEKNPIFLFAKNPGKAIITGESRIDVVADYITVANLLFKNGYPTTDSGVVSLNGNYCRFTNNEINHFELATYDYKWVSLTGTHHTIDRNIFDGKSTGGSLLTVWRNDLTSQYHHIYNNIFRNFSDGGGANGYETMRIGTSTYSQTDSHVLIENNLFEKVSGEIEIISIKSGRTIVRGNTFKECVGLVTCRHGKNSLIENNVFLCGGVTDTGGIRMYDSGHIIRNNYIEQANSSSNTRAGIVIHSGVNEVGVTTTMNLQWVPYNILIENNTIVDSRQSILFCGKYTHAASDIYLKGNLIVSSQWGAIRFDKEPIRAVYEDNHIYTPTFNDASGTIKEVTIPEGANYSTEILKLTPNASGIQLHESFGAKGLIVLTEENIGTKW